ncbi:MAG: nucleotide exchange factor GrpE [Candidatus Nanopelagicales bacterium]
MTEPSGGFSFHDKRRIDPDTFEVREQPSAAPVPSEEVGEPEMPGPPDAGTAPGTGDLDVRDVQIAELTADVQRIQAEYSNYRKRVERDRTLVREQAVASALAELLPVLDDIDRARAHGDLEGAFKSVGEALETTVLRLGLTRFGEPGDPFDPTVHEAIALESSDEVTGPTTTAVHQRGYTFAGRVVRPAVVSVTEPA